jgi:transposase-like protein
MSALLRVKVLKNNHIHYDKQNYMCKKCYRQFVVGSQDWLISDVSKELVDKLLRAYIFGINTIDTLH